MGIQWNPVSDKSSGGTELLCRRLEAGLPQELLDQVQIIPSRLHGELDETKVRILYLHDLPNDPESQKILQHGGERKFHKLVFVSNWQMQAYIQAYNIPWSKCTVIQNSILPIDRASAWRSKDEIKFIYHTTPHRGLDILHAVFEKLAETHDNITLDVYSSFNAYGWPERDKPFEELFKRIGDHPKMNYHGFQPNDVIRDALAHADVFAYPNTWPETSCMALMEAMSAGVLCVHPNFAALPETSANWTMMYQMQDQPNAHAGVLYGVLDGMLKSDPEGYRVQLANAKGYADIFYNWNHRKNQWIEMINSLLGEPREIPEAMWTYRA